MRIKILGRIPGTQLYEALDDEEDDSPYPGEEIPGVLIVRIRDVSLTFGRFLPSPPPFKISGCQILTVFV